MVDKALLLGYQVALTSYRLRLWMKHWGTTWELKLVGRRIHSYQRLQCKLVALTIAESLRHLGCFSKDL